MTRPFAIASLAIAILSIAPKSASAQIYPPIFYPRYPGPPPTFNPPSDPVRYPIEIGEYATVGGASSTPPPHNTTYAIGTVGIYAQWNRYGLCPGLDLRIQGNSSDLHGYLVGPRMVYQPRGRMNPFRLYAKALFGKNESPYNTATPGVLDPAFNSYTGTTRAVAIGLDLHSDSAFVWRILEFTKGDFTGIPNSHPQTITTGIVLHLP